MGFLKSDFDISIPFCLPWVLKDWLMKETKAKHSDISDVSHNGVPTLFFATQNFPIWIERSEQNNENRVGT